MLHVEPKCTILENILVKNLVAPEPPIPGLEFHYIDFDSMIYAVQAREAAPGCLFVSVSLPGFAEIMANGGQQVLNEMYGPMVVPEAEKTKGFDVTLRLDYAALPAERAEREKIAAKVAMIKSNLLGAPIREACKLVESNQVTQKPIQIPYRRDEMMWVVAKPDLVGVCFSLRVKDPNDAPIARVFLNEFNDAARDTKLAGAPRAVVYTTRPPELDGAQFDPAGIDYYVLFAFKKAHMTQGPMRDKNVASVQTFRTYFHYHLKCTKAFIHQRMRSTYVTLLQSLNRARPEQTLQAGTKTASGRTFRKK